MGQTAVSTLQIGGQSVRSFKTKNIRIARKAIGLNTITLMRFHVSIKMEDSCIEVC